MDATAERGRAPALRSEMLTILLLGIELTFINSQPSRCQSVSELPRDSFVLLTCVGDVKQPHQVYDHSPVVQLFRQHFELIFFLTDDDDLRALDDLIEI